MSETRAKKVYVDRVLKNTYQHLTKQVDNSIEYYSDPNIFIQDEFRDTAIWHLQWVKRVIQEFTVNIEDWGEVPVLDEQYYDKRERTDG